MRVGRARLVGPDTASHRVVDAHITEIERCFSAFGTIVRPGGLMCHHVDLSAHDADDPFAFHYAPDVGAGRRRADDLNGLRFSDYEAPRAFATTPRKISGAGAPSSSRANEREWRGEFSKVSGLLRVGSSMIWAAFEEDWPGTRTERENQRFHEDPRDQFNVGRVRRPRGGWRSRRRDQRGVAELHAGRREASLTDAVRIGARVIGPNQPLFLMAECGVTCNYDMTVTLELIDAVRDAGADAIKFILWFPDEIMSDRSIPYTYDTVDGPRSENMYEMLQKLRFTFDQWVEVKRHADARGVVMFSTVNSPTGIVWAEKLGLEAYKLSSWDYNYTPLWERIARLGKPMVIDTGPVNTADVAAAIQLMRDAGNDEAILVHCPHAERPDEVNMRAIPYMREAFRTVVGFSSKGQESETDITAVALGASLIEKRLTMSRALPGHHHILSLEPKEFAAWVRTVRDVQRSLGAFDLRPSPVDLAERKRWFRHLVAARDLRKGTRLTTDMLEGKRPEAGISPERLEWFLGRELKRDPRENEAIRWDDV